MDVQFYRDTNICRVVFNGGETKNEVDSVRRHLGFLTSGKETNVEMVEDGSYPCIEFQVAEDITSMKPILDMAELALQNADPTGDTETKL